MSLILFFESGSPFGFYLFVKRCKLHFVTELEFGVNITQVSEKRDHWGDPGVDGRIIFRKWDVGVWTGLGWLRIETGDGQL
jgi:hypothetical protein